MDKAVVLASCLLGVGLAACSSPALPGDDPSRSIQARACVADRRPCSRDEDCCRGSVCSDVAYADWRCTPKVAAGWGCDRDAQCLSGICRDGACGRAGCAAELGGECSTDEDCCSGFCDNFTYNAWRCLPPQGAGHTCSDDAHCASGRCVDYSCR